MKEMNRRSARWVLGVWALVLAAALLLAGCGGASDAVAPAGPSAAAPAGSGAASQSAAAAAVQTAQKERITDQYTLEKNVSGVWEADTGQYISVHVSVHVPQLECDSPDAASINDELNDIYAAHFREYEAYEEAGQPGSEYPQIGVNWDAYWYGNCVSLVMRDRYGGTAPWFYNGWCFDFATGQQITTAEMLQRMGLDPATVQQQMQRQAMQTFDREMAQGAYYESWRLDGELSQMRMDTLEYNELENLCLLLPEQNQLVIRGRYSSASEERWQQLDMEIPLQTAAQPQAQPVLTDTFDGVQVQLEGTQATITLSPAPKTAIWDTELNLRVEQARTYPILGSYNEYVDVCIGQQTDSVFHPVVYLLTKDGVVEYVDVLRCLLFGNAMICQDPIYIANNGVSLERSGNSKVNLRSCCMSVEWDGWSGILTGTAEGTQGRTEDGTELHFTLTDQNGKPCEFGAILLNDDGSPSGCSLKYRAGEVLFDRDTRPIYWKNDSPDLTLVP